MTLVRMRTTLDLPEDLMKDAMEATRFKSKTDTVIFALRELVRRRNIEELKSLAGKVEVEVDLDKSRRRPGRAR
jgi:Arc/MetJ family transcription regulator